MTVQLKINKQRLADTHSWRFNLGLVFKDPLTLTQGSGVVNPKSRELRPRCSICGRTHAHFQIMIVFIAAVGDILGFLGICIMLNHETMQADSFYNPELRLTAVRRG
jgi:hypothetical protein